MNLKQKFNLYLLYKQFLKTFNIMNTTKAFWQSKTFWFNALTFIVGGATWLTSTFSPQTLTQLGIPVNYVNEGLKMLGGLITVGNIALRSITSGGLTFTNGNTTNGSGK